MDGYGGKILRVNLTTGKITKEQTPVDVARDFIGGRGFGAYYLFKEVPQGADPLGSRKQIDHLKWTHVRFNDPWCREV